MRLFSADLIYVDGEFRTDHVVVVDGAGRVLRVVPQSHLAAEDEETASDLQNLRGMALIPGLVNTHSHAFQVSLPGMGIAPRDFDDWVDRALYPLVLSLGEEDLYQSALFAFARMLRTGTTTIGEFFYVHNRPDGTPSEDENARAVIRAALDLGMRIVLLRSFYDMGSRPAQRRFLESASDARRRTEILAAHYAREDLVRILPAPHSLHGASRDAIEQAADLAEGWDCPYHIHLAEHPSDVDRSLALHGARPLEALDRMGVLSRRTVVVHGCWLSKEERERLAQVGGGIAYNPVSNLHLGDGVTDLAHLMGLRVPVSLGTDANTQPSLFAEMRTALHLQRLAHRSMRPLGEFPAVFGLATLAGGRNLGLPVGSLVPGNWADMVAIDLGDPSLQPIDRERGASLEDRLLSSAGTENAVRHVFVAGIPVLYDGRPVRVELERVARPWRPPRPSGR